jgi:hypothetical protein
MCRYACELHRREGGCGKQHEAKFGHGDLDPENELWFLGLLIQGKAINEQALGWIVAASKRGTRFISRRKTHKNTPVHGVFRLVVRFQHSHPIAAALLRMLESKDH